MNLEPKQLRVPDHTLIRVIGRGAYGEVWLARNIIGTWRAVKIVRRSNFTSERPFNREFEGIRNFEPLSRTHETQLDILHIGRDYEAGHFYYVMELADDCTNGQTIDSETYIPRTLANDLKTNKRLSARQCVEIGLGLAAALDHLHKSGLIHRDIKPANIIFVHGRVKLADIGMVSNFDETASSIGTDGYMPTDGLGTSGGDIFGLGRLLYEISTGLSPLQFPDIPSSFGVEKEDEEIARELNLIINKACAPKAVDRHKNAAELRDDLLLAQSGHSLRKLRDADRRARALKWFGIAAGAVALFALVGYFSAESANRRARASLVSARLAQVRALHTSEQAGRRQAALDAIEEAASIAPSQALRDEALALLPIPDAGPAQKMSAFPEGFTPDIGRHPLRTMSSPDGRLVAWILDNDWLAVTEMATGKEVAPRLRLKLGPKTLAWSPDGRYIGAITASNAVIWDWRANAKTFETLCEKNDTFCPMSFSANGERAALCTGTAVLVVECATGNELRRLPATERSAVFVLHPDGNILGVVSHDTMGAFVVSSGAELFDGAKMGAFAAKAGVRTIAVSRDGKKIASALADGALLLFSQDDGKVALRAGHVGPAYHIAFSPDGELLLSSSPTDGTCIWRLRDGMNPMVRMPGFGLSFSPDGRRIFLLGAEGLEERELHAQPEFFHIVRGHAKHRMELTATDPTGALLAATGDKHDSVDVWQIANGKLSGKVSSFFSGKMSYGWVGFSHDAQTVLAVGEKGLTTAPIVKKDGGEFAIGGTTQKSLGLPCEPGGAGAVSCDEVLAIRAKGNLVLLCDWRKPDAIRRLAVDDGRIVALAWSRDGKRLLVSLNRGGGILFDATTLQRLHVFGSATSLAGFSPDGRFIVLSTQRATILLDPVTFAEIKTFPRPTVENQPGDFSFTDDGKLLAIFQHKGRVDLIELAGKTKVATLEPPTRLLMDRLILTPDGHTLIVSDRSTAYCYDIPALRRGLARIGLDW